METTVLNNTKDLAKAIRGILNVDEISKVVLRIVTRKLRGGTQFDPKVVKALVSAYEKEK